MPPPRDRTRPAPHSHPEKASLPGAEFPHVFLILIHARLKLLGREKARLRQRRTLGPQLPRDEKKQFRLLSGGQGRGCGFDFGERAHARKMPAAARFGKALRALSRRLVELPECSRGSPVEVSGNGFQRCCRFVAIIRLRIGGCGTD